MENQFFVDSDHLSLAALEKKHRLETDPSSRKNHMEYLPGMEQIQSDVRANVMGQVNAFAPSQYTAKDVKAALEHENCSIEDFKVLLSPTAEPFLEQMAQRARLENILAIPFICLPPYISPITAKITASTAASTAITTSAV